MEIVYFGYAGDPSHGGHLDVIEWLARRYGIVKVGLSASHAFNKQMAAMEIRAECADALLSQSKATNVERTNIEEILCGAGPVYSYAVLCALRKQYPEYSIRLAVGPDNAEPATWSRFYNAEKIMEEFGLVVAPDMGGHKRSTHIRAMLSRGATYEELAPLTTPAVAKVLMKYPGLYSTPYNKAA
jgi:nicotinic acid mononucleotide adenylyltransferase